MNRNGLFNRLGYTIEQKRGLYYSTCIPIRVALAFIFGYFGWKYPVQFGLAGIILGGLTIIHLSLLVYGKKARGVWWWRGMHLLFAVAFVIVSRFVYTEDIPGWWLGVVLGLDLLFGIITSLNHFL